MMQDNPDKVGFYSDVMAGRPAIWQIAAGVSFCTRRERMDWGLALQINWNSLRPSQLSEALERRFDHPETYNDYFLFLDSQREFVVWHSVDQQTDERMLDQIRSQQLELAGLEHLDDMPSRH